MYFLSHTPHTSHTWPTPNPSRREGSLNSSAAPLTLEGNQPPSLREGLGVGQVWEVWEVSVLFFFSILYTHTRA